MTDLVLEGYLALKDKATTAAERLFLETQSAALMNRARLFARDEAIRDAFRLLPHLSRSPAANHLEQQLARYLATAWRSERDDEALPADAQQMRRLLHRIARANEGKGIGSRSLLYILDGHRG